MTLAGCCRTALTPLAIGACLAVTSMTTGCSHSDRARVGFYHAESVGVQETIETPDGVGLYIEIVGDGPDVIVIPNGLFMRPFFEELARDQRTLVFFDLRNRGRSETITDPSLLASGIMNDVADIDTVREHLGASKISIIGHSYLGLASAIYTAENPERVSRLTLIGAMWVEPESVEGGDSNAASRSRAERQTALHDLRSSGLPQRDPEEFCRASWRISREGYVARPSLAEEMSDNFCRFENEWPDALARHFSQFIGPSIERLDIDEHDFSAITAPTLIVHGSHDPVVPFDSARKWQSALPSGFVVRVDRAGHMPWLEERSVIGTVDRFLSSERVLEFSTENEGNLSADGTR